MRGIKIGTIVFSLLALAMPRSTGPAVVSQATAAMIDEVTGRCDEAVQQFVLTNSLMESGTKFARTRWQIFASRNSIILLLTIEHNFSSVKQLDGQQGETRGILYGAYNKKFGWVWQGARLDLIDHSKKTIKDYVEVVKQTPALGLVPEIASSRHVTAARMVCQRFIFEVLLIFLFAGGG